MMHIKPDGNDRLVTIDTAYLLLDALVRADGTVEVKAVEVRDPRTPDTPDAAGVALAEQRAAICWTCEVKHNLKPNLYAVKCDDCGCGNLSLIRGKCPRGKWAAAPKN